LRTCILDAKNPEDIKTAAEALLQGELVAFPTETVYGLGANAFEEAAVRRIFEAKGRPADNPLIIHVADKESIFPLVKKVTAAAQCLMEAFMPGPITLLMEKNEKIPPVVNAGLSTVAIRVPSHPIARQLLAHCGVPVAAPSANVSGRPSPTAAAHVFEDMNGKIPWIVDGGACEVGLESTVVDVSGDYPEILRPGAVTEKMIQDCCAKKGIFPPENSVPSIVEENSAPKSPGMKYKHYAPSVPVRIVYPQNQKRASGFIDEIKKEKGLVGIFCSKEEEKEILSALEEKDKKRLLLYTSGEDIKSRASFLFDAFRSLEAKKAEVILAAGFEGEEYTMEGAYMNRLKKAALEDDVLPEKKQVLFVCTGNTCRSPMAEKIFLHLFGKRELFSKNGTPVVLVARSAGIAAFSGSFASEFSIMALQELFSLKEIKHASQQVTEELVADSDIVLCMSQKHKMVLQNAYFSQKEKIFAFSDTFGSGDEKTYQGRDISDPYGGRLEIYKASAKEIQEQIMSLWCFIKDFLKIHEKKV